MCIDVVFPGESLGQLREVDAIFLDDAGHEFFERGGVATFGGVEQVDGVLNGELRNFFPGVLECDEWPGDGVGDGSRGIDDGFSGGRIELLNFCGFGGRDGLGCGGFRGCLGRIEATGDEAQAEKECERAELDFHGSIRRGASGRGLYAEDS